MALEGLLRAFRVRTRNFVPVNGGYIDYAAVEICCAYFLLFVSVNGKYFYFCGMKREEIKITINDVARLSGLSKGTVDRVIHNRGEVSKKSYDKVMEVIRELGYEPNIYASILASRKDHSVVVLVPEYSVGEYWEMADRGTALAREYARTFNINVETVLFNQYSIDSFRDACTRLLEMDPSAVVIAPTFKNETTLLTAELHRRGIPYSYVDTKLEENGYVSYFGMPMYQSGYLCGDLLMDSAGDGQAAKVAVIRLEHDRSRQSDPTVNRRAGFADYMTERHPDTEIVNVFVNPRQPESITGELLGFYKANPGITHVVMFNSRIHLISGFLKALEREGRLPRAVGFDNLDANMEALRGGLVKYLITQHTDEQTRLAITSLVEYLVMKKEPAKRDNYMHMDILSRNNVEHY